MPSLRSRVRRLLLALLVCFALPAAAQDLLSGDSKSETSSEMLQRLLLGKVKESATTAGTKPAPATGSAERLPRKAVGSAPSQAASQGDAAPAKPARTIKPRPAREADFRPLPRLKPAAPISASPTIQPPQPIPMPPGSMP